MPYFRDNKSAVKPNAIQVIPTFATKEGAAMANGELSRLGQLVGNIETTVKKMGAPSSSAAPATTPGDAPPPPPPPPANKISVAHNGSTIVADARRFNFRDTDAAAIDVQSNGSTVNISVTPLLPTPASGVIIVKDDGSIVTIAAGSIDFRDSPTVAFTVSEPTPGAVNVTAAAIGAYLPAGTVNQTLRYNGAAWEASSRLLNYDSTNLGSGVIRMAAMAGDTVPQLVIDSSIAASQPLRITASITSPAASITNTLNTGLSVVSSAGKAAIAAGVTHGLEASATATSGIGVLSTANGASGVGMQAIANTGIGLSAATTTGRAIVASANAGRAIVASNLSNVFSIPCATISNSGTGLSAVALRANVQTGTGIYSDASDGQALNCYNNSGANPTAYFKNDGSTSVTKVIDVDAQGMFGVFVENIYTGTAFEPRAIHARCNNEFGIAVEAHSQSGQAIAATSVGAVSTTTMAVEALGAGTAAYFGSGGSAGAPTVLIHHDLATSLALAVEGRVDISNGPLRITGYSLQIDGDSVVGPRINGWSAATGTASRNSFDTATVTLAELAQRVKALIDDQITHGLIGP